MSLSATAPFNALKPLSRWVLWRETKARKLPCVAQTAPTLTEASSTDPQTWRTYDVTVGALINDAKTRGDRHWYHGPGIALGDLDDGTFLCGVDLDACVAADGTLTAWAQQFIDAVPTYAEVSPSGAGLKQFFLVPAGLIPSLRKACGITGDAMRVKKCFGTSTADHPPSAELFLSGQYFTVTGERWPAGPDKIAIAGADVLQRLARLLQPDKPASTPMPAKPNDTSRSADAMRKGWDARQSGHSYAEFAAAIAADPATADWYAEKGQHHDQRELRRIWNKTEQRTGSAEAVKEDGVATLFAERYHDRLRYCHDHKSWYEWDGNTWRPDNRAVALHLSREMCRQSRALLGSRTGSAASIAAVLRIAETDPKLTVTQQRWDSDDWLLGTPDGTVDLRTGRLRSAMQVDYITKQTAVAPAVTADCPLWYKFLDEATRGDTALTTSLQRWCGYCLTGDVSEQALLFIYGGGGNGKGVFLQTFRKILADYAVNATMDMFEASQFDRHPTELAMLRGARLVTASETEEGRQWAEKRIKLLTGNDPITARAMRENFSTYEPKFKLTFIGNHRPSLSTVDDAIKRRFNLMPFIHKPASVDTKLADKLVAEYPAILRWLIAGCIAWQKHGLGWSAAVTEATREYLAGEDVMGQWLQDRCDVGVHCSECFNRLYGDYIDYARTVHGKQYPVTGKGFSAKLTDLGYKRERNLSGRRGRGFVGVELRR